VEHIALSFTLKYARYAIRSVAISTNAWRAGNGPIAPAHRMVFALVAVRSKNESTELAKIQINWI
jgi:hypothetical protein